jgi:hypothetical protein
MRIYTSASDPLDFCSRHTPGEVLAKKRYGNLGDGPDGRGNCFAYDVEHPDYDGEQRCATCRCKLSERD